MESSAGMLGLGVIFISLTVWTGWGVDLELLKRWLPWMVTMAPATALCLSIAAAGILMQLRRPDGSSGRVIGWVVLIFGGVKMVDSLGWVHMPFDEWFVPHHEEKAGAGYRIAPNAAACFILSGSALALPSTILFTHLRVAEILAALTGLISLLTLTGYIYQVRWLHGTAAYIPMALPTAIAFLMLSAAIIFARPREGMMSVATSDSSGAILLQRMFPAMIVVFIVAGALRLIGERSGLYDREFGVALFTLASMGIFFVLLVSCALSIHRSEMSRRAAEAGIVRLNEELLVQKSWLELLNREMESFSYSVSHDLRAPLRGIAGFAEALEEREHDTLDDTSRNYLARIRKAAGFMGSLIDDLLQLSRLSRTEMKYTEVDLSELAARVVADLKQDEPQRNVEVCITPGIKVNGDPSLLAILLDNLLGNAWKFTGKVEGARIELGMRPSSGSASHVFCYIRDNGVGFDNRYRHKLFGAFQRLHSSNEFAGTGIGLATVQRVLHRHGCEISADGKLGEGACFDFTLPKALN